MLSRLRATPASAIVLTLLAGCGGSSRPQSPAAALPELNQSEICQTSSMGIAKNCKPGQKIVFLPEQFGNAQLPVYFAAANCDLRYTVVLTNGAVTCIFNPIKPAAEEPNASSAPASQPQGQ